MSTEQYQDYLFRYVHDKRSPGKIRVYVEVMPEYQRIGIDSRSLHLARGSDSTPPFIDFRECRKPPSFSSAQVLARKWANETDRIVRERYLSSINGQRGGNSAESECFSLRDGIELAKLVWTVLAVFL